MTDSSVQRMYSRCKPTQETPTGYVEVCKRQFTRDGINYIIHLSQDTQMTNASLTDSIPTNNTQLPNKLSTKVRALSKLIFFHGAMFEATVNAKGDGATANHNLVSR